MTTFTKRIDINDLEEAIMLDDSAQIGSSNNKYQLEDSENEIVFLKEVNTRNRNNHRQFEDSENEIVFLSNSNTNENNTETVTETKQQRLMVSELPITESPIKVIDVGDENVLMHKYKINTVKIRIEAGDLFKTKSKALFNVVDTDLNLKYSEPYTLKYGLSLFDQLKTYNKLTFQPNESIYQIALTNHFDQVYLSKIYHSHLLNYEFQNDLSEIKLKNLIKNLLILVKQFSDKSICIPFKYFLDVGYPANLLINLVDEVLNQYLNLTEDHKIDEIYIHIDSNEKNLIQLVKEKYSNKLTDELTLNYEFKLENLDPNSVEYKLVFDLFKKTLPRALVFQIEKINNSLLKQMYSVLKEATRSNNPKEKPVEWKLFHGTDSGSIYKICESGFNRSYGGKHGTSYGKGVYFARDSSYSHKYTGIQRHMQNESLMLLSSVIVGQYERGSYSMIDTTKHVDGKQYDSTVDNIYQPTVFVIYKDFQALPEYLIHYSCFIN